ncbi:nitrogen regulation protein NR(II) [Erythrobacter sp. SCSIO 43205]|uniref:two-component system sensor histidine kinase NtrB n=1 Tax=Erythrobacter sp. SCSIO 43205 TaxID=2779361 RepID=UPI002102C436|nr:ATP-binding protein [Erythrobacter sp. SCSIO 43205]
MASPSTISSSDLSSPGAAEQIEGLLFALILIDPSLRVVQVNQAAENMLGKSAKRLKGANLIELIGPLDPRVEHRLSVNDAALVAREITISASETEKRVNLTASPLVSHPGWRVITLSEVGYDEAGNDEELASTIGAPSILAHEIKNPLAAIRGAAQLAARKLKGADTKLATMITDEVDRIVRLIDRMQQLGSRTPEVTKACNPHEAIRTAIATVRAADKGKVEIIEEFDPSLPPVLANQDALEQVLINLISNARDAVSSAAKGQVTVRTRFVSGLAFSAIRLGRAVRLPIEITISDNGPGVDPTMRDHIFEPFVSSKPSGQGLGLALVRKLVHDMNGSISHERDAKKAMTRFRVHLPLAKVNASESEGA